MDNKNSKIPEKAYFWIRFALWLIFALIIPFGFICWKFNLFQTTTNTSITFGGWGIIAIIILFFVLRAMINYVKKGLPYSMTTQCLNGFIKIVLPLGVVILIGYILLTTFKDGLTNFLVVSGVILGCEIIAIPLNPFPKWISENQSKLRKQETEEATRSVLKEFVNDFIKKDNNSEK